MKKKNIKRRLAAAAAAGMLLTGAAPAFAVEADPAKAAIEDQHECSLQGHIDMTYDEFKAAAGDALQALGIDLGALSGLNVTLTRGQKLNDYSVVGMYMNEEKQSTFSFFFDAKSGRLHSFVIMDKKYEDAAAKAEATLKAIGFTEDEIKDTLKKLEKSNGQDMVEIKEILFRKNESQEYSSIEIQAKRSETKEAKVVSAEDKPQCVRDIEDLIASAKVSSYPTQFDITYAVLADASASKLKKEGFDYEKCSAMYTLSNLRGKITGDSAVYAYEESDKASYKTEIDYDPATTKVNYIQINDKTAADCNKKLDIFLEALGLDKNTRTTAEDAFVKAAKEKKDGEIAPIPAGAYVLDVRVSENGVTVGIGKE